MPGSAPLFGLGLQGLRHTPEPAHGVAGTGTRPPRRPPREVSRRRRILSSDMRQLSVAVIAVFALIAQDDSTIRVSTRLVEVDVVAHDRSGKPIADLTKEDFTVYDGHARQSVSVFALHRV